MVHGDTAIFNVTKAGQIQTIRSVSLKNDTDLSQTIAVCVNNTQEYTLSDEGDYCRIITVTIEV